MGPGTAQTPAAPLQAPVPQLQHTPKMGQWARALPTAWKRFRVSASGLCVLSPFFLSEGHPTKGSVPEKLRREAGIGRESRRKGSSTQCRSRRGPEGTRGENVKRDRAWRQKSPLAELPGARSDGASFSRETLGGLLVLTGRRGPCPLACPLSRGSPGLPPPGSGLTLPAL